jgi:hypothetical protein
MKIAICLLFIFALLFVHTEKLKKSEEKKRGYGYPNAGNVLVMEGVNK